MTTQPVPSTRPDATNPDAYHPDHAAPAASTVEAALARSSGSRAVDLAEQARSAPVRTTTPRAQAAPASLRGKKYDITLAKVEAYARDDGTPYWRLVGTEVEVVGLSFDNNSIAEIEDTWGSIDNWQQAIDIKPAKTLRDSIAIALDRDPIAIGVAMLTDHRQNYIAMLGLAFSLANGVDPTPLETAYKLMDEGVEPEEAYRQAGVTDS